MAFLDDPLMLGMFGASGSNALSRNLMQMRALRYMRPPIERMSASRQSGSNPFFGQMSAMEGQPNYSQFTFDPAARQQAEAALSPYGLHPLSPDQVNPFTIFPNSGFFGNHPRLTQALEGGIYGGAMSHGANTWGEGISSVAQGILGGRMARNAAWQQQFAAPFQSANVLEDLQDRQQKRELTEADIQWRRAEAQKALRDPMPKYTGHVATDEGAVYAFDQQGNPKQLLPPGSVSHPDKTAAKNPLGQGLEAQIIFGELGPMPTDPKAQQTYYKKAESARNRMAAAGAANRAAGAFAGQGDRRDYEEDKRNEDKRNDWISKNIANPETMFTLGIDPSAPDASAKLGKYYDDKIAPLMTKPSDSNNPMPQKKQSSAPINITLPSGKKLRIE